ncbi:MAG: radical SAM protein [Candidatus Omnitrophota bacterium]
MIDILLINPYPESAYGINEGTVEPPIGLGYLAAIAGQKGVSCRVIDANVLHIKADELFSEIKSMMPAIVGISVNLYSYQVSLKLTRIIKDSFPEMVVLLGGPTPSSTPLKVMNESMADAVVIGEAEETFGEILGRYKEKGHLFKDIAGLSYRQDGKVIANSGRAFIKDINLLPFPAYELFPDFKNYKMKARKRPVAPLITSRGCFYQCVFCSKDVFKDVCRMRSPESVIQEIDILVKKYGVKQIDILDDNFTSDKKRTEKILDLIIERNYDLCINLQTGVRTESLDENIIQKMKKARIWKFGIGVESGDAAVLKKIKKHLDLNRVLEVTRMARKAGIEVYGFFIIGLPGDTAESMQKTIDFAIRMNPTIANFCIAIPFPGTELYEMIQKEGRFLIKVDDGIDTGFYANEVFYELDGMSKETILRYYKKAMRDFYFRPAKIFELVMGIRSKDEFKWLFSTGFSVIKNFFKKKHELLK